MKKRFIAVLIMRDCKVVQSVQFNHTNIIHSSPVIAVEQFSKWDVDEIIILNVDRKSDGLENFIAMINKIVSKCFLPVTVGGWVKDVKTCEMIFESGADKILLNSHLFEQNNLVSELAAKYGSQAIVAGIDVKLNEIGEKSVFKNRGREDTNCKPVEWAQKVISLGVGEIFLSSINHDGMREGYDLKLMSEVSSSVSVPVIAFGGVSNWMQIVDAAQKTECEGFAVANALHYTDSSARKAKKIIKENGIDIR